MNLKRYIEDVHSTEKGDVNTLPIMSLFVMLLPFLLLTTVFVNTAVFQLYLPKKKKTGQAYTENKDGKKNDKRLFVSLSKDGLRIGIDKKISESYSIGAFEREMKEVRKRFFRKKDIVIVSEPQIKYSKLIDVMDILANLGFEHISLAGNK